MVRVGLRERQGLGEPRGEARHLLFGQAGKLLGGRVVGSGSGIINRHFLSEEEKVYSLDRTSALKCLEVKE